VQFSQKVNPKNIMKANFKNRIGQNTFGGALLYRLQEKEDTSTINQLLVIWGYDPEGGLYLNAYLIEHDIIVIWNEDELKRLHDVYSSQYKAYIALIWEVYWLLDDNMKLKIERKMSRGGLEMNITISDHESSLSSIKPLWVDPIR
jgi:hypothetical protein